MAVGGRKPVPGGDVQRARAHTQSGDIVAMEPPEGMSPRAQAHWKVAVEGLIAMKVFQLSDAPQLAHYCRSLAMADDFADEIDMLARELESAYESKNFDLAEMISGQIKRARSGYVQMLTIVSRIGGDFAMSPVARIRLGLMAAQGAKSLDEYFNKGTSAGPR